MTIARALTLLAIALATSSTAFAVTLIEIAGGLRQPIAIVAPDDGSGRLFVAEQRGTLIQILPERSAQPWLDLSDRTRAAGERGLLGVAFHPDFARNGRLFVHYTDLRGDGVLSEIAAGTEPKAASERILLRVAQPFPNHNGGAIAFGPDGMLYLGLGDGGGAGDPVAAGQDLGSLLGAILRLDVDTAPGSIVVPADNPFVDVAGARPEIWAYGLRNPWRFSFDPRNGDLWIADVGQNAVEEINHQDASSRGGENYGWRTMEGDRCFDPRRNCDAAGLTPPVFVYTHASGWGRSVTGGVVPTGPAAPSLQGAYLFGDFASGRLAALDRDGDFFTARTLLETGMAISTFGLDSHGDAYLADYRGAIHRIVD
jgi:glucose/arabinose dehydrogenase